MIGSNFNIQQANSLFGRNNSNSFRSSIKGENSSVYIRNARYGPSVLEQKPGGVSSFARAGNNTFAPIPDMSKQNTNVGYGRY